MKPEIIITAKGHKGAFERLTQEFSAIPLFESKDRAAALKEAVPRVRALAHTGHGKVDSALMDALPKLEIISNFGVGVDQINLDAVTLAKNADALVVITPGGADTDKLGNAPVLDALGPRGYLVNVARGSVVDERVLPRYLQENKIAGAGLDVFEHEPKVPAEFFTLDNVVLPPHVASATHETRTAMGNLQIENLHLHFAGQPVKTPV